MQESCLFVDCKSVLTQTLVLMGITEEDMVKLTDPGKLGHKLRASIGKMKESYERRIEQLEEVGMGLVFESLI